MPSPIGHGLAAIAAGWVVERPATPRRALWIQAATLAAIGIAPDLDLLVGRHHAEVHSLFAGAVVACLAAWRRWPIAQTRWRIWLAAFLAWATHPLLDALAYDASRPMGIMVLWPLSSAHYTTKLHIFNSIWRNWWRAGWFTHNFIAATREIAILLPITVLVWWLRAPTHVAPKPGS